MAVEHGLGLVVVDNADDVDRLEATVPAGRAQDVLVRVIPGVTADTHAHVLTGHEGSKFGLAPRGRRRADPPDRAQPAPAHARPARARRLADPRRRAVRAGGRAGRRARRVPGLRPRRRARRPLHLRRRAADASAPTSTRWSAPPASTCPPDAELIIEPGRSMVASAATTLYRVVTVKRGARTFVAVDGGMGDNLEVALFGQRFEAAIADRVGAAGGEPVTRGRPPLRERRRAGRRGRARPARGSATCWPSRRPAPTASRWPTTTTAPAASPSCSRATARPAWSCAARRWADLLARDVD